MVRHATHLSMMIIIIMIQHTPRENVCKKKKYSTSLEIVSTNLHTHTQTNEQNETPSLYFFSGLFLDQKNIESYRMNEWKKQLKVNRPGMPGKQTNTFYLHYTCCCCCLDWSFIFCSYFVLIFTKWIWLIGCSLYHISKKKKIFSYFRHIIVVFFRFSAVVVVVGSPMSQFDTCQRVVAHVLFRFDSIFFVPKFIKHLFRKEGSFRIEHLFDFVLVFTLKWRKKISLRFYFKLIPIDWEFCIRKWTFIFYFWINFQRIIWLSSSIQNVCLIGSHFLG